MNPVGRVAVERYTKMKRMNFREIECGNRFLRSAADKLAGFFNHRL